MDIFGHYMPMILSLKTLIRFDCQDVMRDISTKGLFGALNAKQGKKPPC